MTDQAPETPLTSQAAERIRTADPFITREIEVPLSAPNPHEKRGSGRREVTRTAGKDTPLDSKPTLRARRPEKRRGHRARLLTRTRRMQRRLVRSAQGPS